MARLSAIGRIGAIGPVGLIGAIIAATTACSSLLGLDTVQYDVDAVDGTGPETEGGAADAPAESAVVPDGGCAQASPDAGCSDGYYAAVMADQPVAYFRLSEPSLPSRLQCRNEVACSTYTCSYSPSGLAFGAKGENACAPAVHLDPSSGSVAFADAAGALDFPGNVPFTIEAWIELDAVDGAIPLEPLAGAMQPNAGHGPFSGYILSIDGLGPGPRDEMWVAGQAALYSQIHGLAAAGSPFHLVLVHTTADNIDHLYVDGTGTADEGPTTLVPMPLRPASGLPLTWAGFAGSLGEVAIYDKALSPGQILKHFNAGGS